MTRFNASAVSLSVCVVAIALASNLGENAEGIGYARVAVDPVRDRISASPC